MRTILLGPKNTQKKLRRCPKRRINSPCSIRQLPSGPIISHYENIGAYCDFFLIPIARKQSTYINDMIDCINKIESHENLPDIQSIKYDVNSIQTWNLTSFSVLSTIHTTTQANTNIAFHIQMSKISFFCSNVY